MHVIENDQHGCLAHRYVVQEQKTSSLGSFLEFKKLGNSIRVKNPLRAGRGYFVMVSELQVKISMTYNLSH